MLATKVYRLYDWRARELGVQHATKLEEQFGKPTEVPKYYPDAIWVEYESTDDGKLIKEKFLWEVK